MKIRIKLGKSSEVKVPTICAGCSAPIAPDATFCEACHAPIVRRYCPKCSKLVPENSVNCPYCGTSSKMKVLDSAVAIPNITILAVIGMIAAFFLMAGFFPGEKAAKQLPPAPSVQLSEAAKPASLTSNQAQASRTLPVSNAQVVIRSDEEGTKLNLQAYELMQTGDYQKAEEILRQAVQSFPQGTTAVGYKYALYNLGHILRKTGRAKESLSYLQKCAQIDPEWSKIQTELAVAKQQAEGSTAVM